MTRARPDAGDFLRLTRLWGSDLPGPVWAVVVRRFGTEHPALDIDVEVFTGQEIIEAHLGLGASLSTVPVDEDDEFRVHTINTMPQYALAAWVQRQLTKGSD
jgi:hypothetical protein